MVVQAAIGELSSDSNTYLIAGAIGIALVGTAFPILFFRKDQLIISYLFFILIISVQCLNLRMRFNFPLWFFVISGALNARELASLGSLV